MTRSQAFRQRKLNYRQSLPIHRDDQVEDFEDELQRNVHKIDTGVEQGEQNVRTLSSSFLALSDFWLFVVLVASSACRCLFPFFLCFAFHITTRDLTSPQRNTICKLPFRHLRLLLSVVRLRRYTSPHRMLCRARFNMRNCILSPIRNLPLTSAFHPP